MSHSRIVSTLLFATFVFCSTLAWSQATVDETLETAIVYVDVNHGSDSNPGTQLLPLQTISAAAVLANTNNQAGIGTKVIINPGTYRETVVPPKSGRNTDLPITFQAAVSGSVIVSGADVWTNWKTYSGNQKAYTNSWPYQWGLCALDGGGIYPEEDIVRRREMIFVNGVSMTQVMSISAMRTGTFYVDESHGTVYLWPPSGTNMTTARVEVSTRSSLLDISKLTNIVVRGLTFQYANTCRGDAAVVATASASNILFDTDRFRWNNSAGLKLQTTTNTTVQNSVANYNGASGMMGYKTKYDLWENNRTRYNNWRGAQGVYYDWGVAGTHFGYAHDQTVSNIDSSYNQTFGFHWDTDNQNVTANALVASQNQLGGGFVEKSEGPVTISNSSFCNGNPYSGPNNLGFELRNSTYVTLTGDTFFNTGSQVYVTGQAGGIPVTNWETGQSYNLISQNLTTTNNVMVGGTSQMLFQDGSLGDSDWTTFESTLASDYNTWWNSTTTKAFILPVPNNWTKTDFAGWQSTTGKDAHSGWAQPHNAGAECTLSPGNPDFWLITTALGGYQTVTRGNSATFTGYLIPLGFTGTISLSSDGLQGVTGMKGTWSAGTINNSGSATFTVTTSSSTPTGSHPITLIANSGNLTRTMTVTVTVQ